MVFPNRRITARKSILEALREHDNPENGIGYNLLFEKVKGNIGSRTTFEKYLKELQQEGYIAKEEDPRHKRGVIIYRLKESKYELMTIHFMLKLKALFETKRIKQLEIDKKLGSKKLTKNVQVIANCLTLTYNTLIKMLPEIKTQYGPHPYLSIVEKGNKILLNFKGNTSKINGNNSSIE
jgi:DNA-binding MarR family transcriptional regulator